MLQLRTLAAVTLCAAGVAAAAIPVGSMFQDDQDPLGMVKPHEVHKQMAKAVGEWTGTITWEQPGGPPGESKATETVTALGPFHTVVDFRSEFMGMPYHGHGVTSFDPTTGEVLNTWSDNMSPETMIMKGTYDLEKNTTELTWMAPPMPGVEMKVRHRQVTVHKGDKYVSTFYMGEGDKEIENMKISMTKKK